MSMNFPAFQTSESKIGSYRHEQRPTSGLAGTHRNTAGQARYPSKIPAKSSAMASKGGTRTGLRSVAVSLATTR